MKSLSTHPVSEQPVDSPAGKITIRIISPEISILLWRKRAARAAAICFLTLCAACATNSGKSASGDPKTFNFTAYANETAEKQGTYYFNSRKNLSLRPTGGRIVWEDYGIRQKHVATYSSANCRYLLHADAGGASGYPSTRIQFPLLRTSSATQCNYYIEIFDSYYINGYEQRFMVYDNRQRNVDDLYIWLPMRGTNNRHTFDVTRVDASREGKPYYLITRLLFKKDYIVYSGRNNKLLKIYAGSYITFQNRSFFKAYRGVFVK